ncbi:hypothetical protein NG799_25930 [Laspinema sp. D1]|uniref:Uncharacterized protein n=1 Tax=Laspinema palackyanum D2a TaxID=2953684 RepID=A0ABT2N291_9CYAN|nr:hypothetical protein [Laspinema sp. D2a]
MTESELKQNVIAALRTANDDKYGIFPTRIRDYIREKNSGIFVDLKDIRKVLEHLQARGIARQSFDKWKLVNR